MIEIVLSGFFMLLGLKNKNKMNPLVIFNGIWFLCFFFYKLELSASYTNEISTKASLVFVSMIIVFNLGFFFGNAIRKRGSIGFKMTIIKADTKEKYLNKIFYLYIALIIFEIIVFRGVPILWILQGRTDVSYVTFGIPSLHGFINSLAWFIANVSLIEFLNSKNKVALRNLICINLVFIMLLARQSMVTEIVQLTTIFFMKRKVEIKKLIILAILFVVGFGLIGNLRTPPEVIYYSSGFKYQIPVFLLGIVWVYMYMISPIANIINYINNYTNFQHGLLSFTNVMPSVIVNKLNMSPKGEVESYLVHETYNMSTGLAPIYGDFGIIGIIVFFGLIGVLGGILFKGFTVSKNADMVISEYAIYAGAVALIFFFNEFITLPILVQFVYNGLFFRNYFFCKDSRSMSQLNKETCLHFSEQETVYNGNA